MTTTILNRKISEVENKMLNNCSLVTTPILNTKISEVENKIPNHLQVMMDLNGSQNTFVINQHLIC